MRALVVNVVLGLVPLLILGASFAAGTEDDRHHRRAFLLVLGLWSLTLAMWNWMRSAPVGWIAFWGAAGAASLAAFRMRRP